ncbi:MAG: 16S rRNA processing protein RimM [Chitinophagaceae bacterium]|nr:16S rRNA processing protein RimM [Chitinophagaceae bacterium]MCW5904123.1 16S rRNA processing protein RimM [Chitinophagaceae bacterium]
MMSQYTQIGKIVATFGTKGEVIVQHSLGKKSTLKNVEAIFIEITKGNYIPYFISSVKAKNITESWIKLEGVDNKEMAHKLISKKVWLTEEDFRKQVAKQAAIKLLDYTIIDNKTVIGSVQKVIEQPHQILLSTLYNNNEALIPLNEATLLKINHTKKEIHVQLPDGLLEIYS